MDGLLTYVNEQLMLRVYCGMFQWEALLCSALHQLSCAKLMHADVV